MKNFEKAGQVLCEIWNSMTIDGYPVQCTYCDPLIYVADPPTLDPEWVESHCMISKYCLQNATMQTAAHLQGRTSRSSLVEDSCLVRY